MYALLIRSSLYFYISNTTLIIDKLLMLMNWSMNVSCDLHYCTLAILCN